MDAAQILELFLSASPAAGLVKTHASTSWLSVRLSSSNCLSRRGEDTPEPPNFLHETYNQRGWRDAHHAAHLNTGA